MQLLCALCAFGTFIMQFVVHNATEHTDLQVLAWVRPIHDNESRHWHS